jgi:hypothetical protein
MNSIDISDSDAGDPFNSYYYPFMITSKCKNKKIIIKKTINSHLFKYKLDYTTYDDNTNIYSHIYKKPVISKK